MPANNNSNNDLENGAFDVGTNFNLLVANDGNPGLITFEYNATDNASVTGTIATNEVGALGSCEAFGHVLSS